MKAIIAGFAAIVIIAVAAGYGLNQMGAPTDEAQSGDDVRLD
ncbi:MAG: hypothetical protein AAFQ79_02125 [Pseudomonadota bacterium]